MFEAVRLARNPNMQPGRWHEQCLSKGTLGLVGPGDNRKALGLVLYVLRPLSRGFRGSERRSLPLSHTHCCARGVIFGLFQSPEAL